MTMYINNVELEKCDIYVFDKKTEDSHSAVNLNIFIVRYMTRCGDATFE